MINCIKGYHALVKAKVYNQFSRLSITELGMRKFQQVTIYKQLVRLSEAYQRILSHPTLQMSYVLALLPLQSRK